MVFTSFLDRENLSLIKWHLTKSSYSKLSFEEIHTLLDDFDSDDENDIDNLANDSATKFVDRTVTENLEIGISEDIYKKGDSNVSNFNSTTKPIEAGHELQNKILNPRMMLMMFIVQFGSKKMLLGNGISILKSHY